MKLKEISYIHAEGYPAAEMKHGPIALVDEHTPSVFLMPHGQVYDKVMSNLQEIKARGGPVIAVVCEGDTEAARLADDIIEIPAVEEYLAADRHGDPAATAGLSHRRGPRLRRRQAAEPGEERDGGMTGNRLRPRKERSVVTTSVGSEEISDVPFSGPRPVFRPCLQTVQRKDNSMNRIILLMLTLGLSLAPVLCWAAEPNADQAKAIAEIENWVARFIV